MADYSITIQNTTSLSLHGIAPTTKWDFATWDVSKWNEGSEDLIQRIVKVIDNTLTPGTSYIFRFIKVFNNDFSFISDIDQQTLSDPAGWNHVFIRPSIDADEQVITSFTALDPSTTTWTSLTATSAAWS